MWWYCCMFVRYYLIILTVITELNTAVLCLLELWTKCRWTSWQRCPLQHRSPQLTVQRLCYLVVLGCQSLMSGPLMMSLCQLKPSSQVTQLSHHHHYVRDCRLADWTLCNRSSHIKGRKDECRVLCTALLTWSLEALYNRVSTTPGNLLEFNWSS